MIEMERQNRGLVRQAIIATAIVIPLITGAIWIRDDRGKLRTVVLESPNGRIVAEVADTPESRSTGLSNRDALNGVDGLLLQWDVPGRHPIWMAGMRFALDVVWLDADGRVVAALAKVPPCLAEPCPLYEPEGSERSVAVLEMRAGGASVHRLAAGAIVRPSFASQPAQ